MRARYRTIEASSQEEFYEVSLYHHIIEKLKNIEDMNK